VLRDGGIIEGAIIEGGKLEGRIIDRGTNLYLFFILPFPKQRNSEFLHRIRRNFVKFLFSGYSGILRNVMSMPTEVGSTE
jgi:hypothetical protein